MELVELPPAMQPLRLIVLLDWTPRASIKPNTELLKQMHKIRSRQSEHSRKRQAFISGMAIHRTDANELSAKRLYLEDWHARIDENA